MTHRDHNEHFHSLYERHYRRISGYFRRMGFPSESAHELTQKTFLRVYSNMESIDGRTEAQKTVYINTTARSVLANELRGRLAKKRAAKETSLDSPTHPSGDATEGQRIPDPSQNPEEELIEKQQRLFQRKRLYRAICELSPDKRCPLLLWLGGLSYIEIAAAMQITLDTVKSRLYVAKKELEKELGEPIDLPRQPEEDDD